jgi:hypothetical protein
MNSATTATMIQPTVRRVASRMRMTASTPIAMSSGVGTTARRENSW